MNTKKYNRFLRGLINNKIIIVAIIMAVVLSNLSPVFLNARNILNILRQVSVGIIIGAGFTVVLGSGLIDLSIGSQLGLCGIIMAKIMVVGCSPILAVLITLMCSVIFGALNATIISTFKLPAFIVTMATSNIFLGAGYLITKMAPIIGLPDSIIEIGQGSWLGIPIPIYIMLMTVVIVYILVNYSSFGRYAIAIGGNEEAARVSGIRVEWVRLESYILLSFCGGVAAIIQTARSASAQVAAGQGFEMDAVAAVVMGGTALNGGNANVVGTVFGALIVGMVNNGLNLLGVDSSWQVVAKGLLILIAVVAGSAPTLFPKKHTK